jgi:indole-3-glycerol phosphate synthase
MTVLEEIILGVKEDLHNRKSLVSHEEIVERAHQAPPVLDVLHRINEETFGVIAEVKRSSPSKGELAQISDPATLALAYQSGGAAAVSVLTEERRFKGSLKDLAAVRAAVSIPVLRKEFIVDEYQIFEARAYGADIILLIVAALTDDEILNFSKITHSLGMRTLVEIHDEVELARVVHLMDARALTIDLLGINARNLKTLEINPEAFGALAAKAPAGIALIAESGISSAEEVGALAREGACGILVGEALVKDGQPAERIKDFLNRAQIERVRRLTS